MEISINASLGNNRDGEVVGPVTDEGGSFGSHPEDVYRSAMDDSLKQAMGKQDYDSAYTALTIACRALVKVGMPINLMFEYQDKLSESFAKRHEPVAPVQNIDQMISVGHNNGTLKGNIANQDYQIGGMPVNPTNPKLPQE